MTVWQIVWSSTARQQAIETQSWWIENRAEAPTLFLDELAEVTSLLVQQPLLGLPYIHPRTTGLRRVLLVRSKRHVYYRVHEARHEVSLVAIWGGVRSAPPVVDE